MDDWSSPRAGGCRCGAIRFAVRGRPLLTMACHCTGCQKMTGGPFSLSAAIPSEAFALTAGEPVIGGAHDDGLHHLFCPRCMSWIFTRIEGMDMFVNIRSTMLDYPRGTEPFLETWTSEKLPWATTPARRSYPRFAPPEDYAALTADYLRDGTG